MDDWEARLLLLHLIEANTSRAWFTSNTCLGDGEWTLD